MHDWLVFFVIIAGGGIVIALARCIVDRVPRSGAVEALAAGLSTTELALLSGGPGRAIDAKVVELVETGYVVAAQGSFALTDRAHARLAAPADPETFDAVRVEVLTVIRGGGHRGLEVVRRRSSTWALSWAMKTLRDHRLIITPLRRQWSAMVLVAPVLLGMFGASMGLVMNDFMGDLEVAGAVTIGLWLPIALLIGVIWNLRPGYHGRNPQSRSGRDVLTVRRGQLDATSTEAERVALDGLAAIDDPALREAIRGDAPESRWRVSFRRRRYDSTDALMAAALGMAISTGFDGGSGDGGDSGGADGGGGGGD